MEGDKENFKAKLKNVWILSEDHRDIGEDTSLSEYSGYTEKIHQICKERYSGTNRKDVKVETLVEKLLETDMSRKDLYNLLRYYPNGAKFVYKKYQDLRPLVEELCDPDNLLYLPDVNETLQLPRQVKNLEEELKTLNRSIEGKTTERNNLIESLNEMETKYNTLEEKVKTAKINLETLETQVMNLHGKAGLEKITSYLVQVQKFIKKTYDDRENKDIGVIGMGIFKIDRDDFHDLLTEAEKLELYLKSDEFTKEDITNEKSEIAKLREQIAVETEQALKELEITKYMKISEKLGKLSQGALFNLNFVKDRQQRNDPEYKLPGYNGLIENMVDILNTMGDLMRQIENKKNLDKGGE